MTVALNVGGIRQRFSRHKERNRFNSIAVLPLENLSGDATQDYFAEGMTETLTTDLARIVTIRVMARSSVTPYKSTPKPVREIGRELNVEAVLTGSVARSGERVRIAVQLVDVATQQNIWANSYDRDLRDVLTLQSEVARDVVNQLSNKLSPQTDIRSTRVQSLNPEAYDAYLRGRFFLNRQTKEDNDLAIAALEHAVSVDPSFAAAHAQLAQAYVWKLFLFAPDQKEWNEKAFVETEKALELDPDSAVAHLARGRLLWTPANHFPHDKAIREYQRALSIDPTLDEARNQLALVYCHVGFFEEALAQSRQAITTNPNNNLAQLRIGQTLNFQGKYGEALEVLRAIPQQTNPSLLGHQIAWSLFNLGKRDEASALLEQLLKDQKEDTGGVFTSVQAVVAASAGQQQLSEEKIKSAIQKGKGFGHFHHTAYHIACAYARLKKIDEAIKWLEIAADDGFPCYPLFQSDTNLDNLRQDPKFADFLARLRGRWESYQKSS
jgi:TolB-like protein/Tfp pilus assembly protein PilF